MPRGKKAATELTISQLQARSRFLDRLPGAIIKLAKEDRIELTLPIKKRRKHGPNKKKVTRAKAAKPPTPPPTAPPASPPGPRPEV